MRLLSCKSDGGFNLTTFKDNDEVPPYAILSHTWSEGQEVTYDELIAGTGKEKTGYSKLRFCGERTSQDGLGYFWVDTCCIDKNDSTELSIAINSMFRWYQRASKCYVYLSIVHLPAQVNDIQAFRSVWEGAFRYNRWFTRGWTLQELLAPGVVEFFSEEGRKLGDKISLEQQIQEVTGMPVAALRSHDFRGFGVEERINWVSKRKTKYPEDKVYCLLGLFGVFLPVNYGEGEEYAFHRLRREIETQAKSSGASDEAKVSASLLLPFSRNERFVGRDSHFEVLEQWSRRHGHRRMSIYGLGGCGKTAIALEFAYRTLAKHPQYLVFWVPAISQETFELSYRDIGELLRIPGTTDDNADVKRLVKNGLSSGDFGDWLMIVDNADETSVLFDGPQSNRLIDYLPRSDRGSILFTTRSRKTAESLSKTNLFKLEDMSKAKDEARQLMNLQVSDEALLDDDDAVDELLDLLTHLPLAITQATAFINQNNTPISEYVSLFKDVNNEAELFGEHFKDPNRYEEIENTVAKTWYISFNQIRQQDQLAADYLSFMACIDRTSIPLSLLPAGDSALKRVKAIGTLTGYALITERQQDVQQVQKEKCFDVHRLVHMASKWWLQEHEEVTNLSEKVVSRLEDVLPYGGHEGRNTWVNYIPHAILVAKQVDLSQMAKASLLGRIGECQSELGQYSAAEANHRQTLELEEEVLGPRHPDTLSSMSNLASVLNSEGKYVEAEAIHRQTLELCTEILGPRHPNTLSSMNNLALVLDNQGKYSKAEAMNRQTLDLRKEILGLQHPGTLSSMNNLALVLNNQGKYEEAEAMHRQELELTKEVLGPRHPDTLSSMSNLASVLNSQGKYVEAEAIHRQTLELYTEILGPRHPHTLSSMNNLALVLDNQGKYSKAEAMNRQTLDLKKEILGLQHPGTLTSMSNLALVLNSQGKYEEAEAIHRQTLDLRKEVLGPRYPDTLTSMNNLASVLNSEGKYVEAEAIHRQTLELCTEILGPRHPHTLSSMSNLASVLDSQGKYTEAEAMHRQGLELTKEVLGLRHPDTLSSMNNLALVLERQGKYEEAEAMNRQTLDLRKEILGLQHPGTLSSMNNLALVLNSQGKYEEAEKVRAGLEEKP